MLLLFPAASYRVDAYVEAARRLGVELTLATELPQSFKRHGVPVIGVDFAAPERSAEAILEASRAAPFDGIVPTDEASAVVAALVAGRLGLPHNLAEGARAARDKRRMRAALARAGVPSPRHRVVAPAEEAEALLAEVRFPCVVKPPMLTGSQGVIRADDPGELARALHRVRKILEKHPAQNQDPGFFELIVEDYLPGVEVSVEALLTRGVVQPLAIFDKPDELVGPFFEETLYVTPSRLPEATQKAILEVTAAAAAALGLRHGPIHAELRIDGGRPAIVELAARSIGGLCSRTLSFVAGSLEELVVRHAVGMEVTSYARSGGAAGVMMIPIPRSGVLKRVTGLEEARAVPGIVEATIALEPGDRIRALPEGASYLGFLFARGETPEGVERALREAHARLRFELSPLLS